MSTYQSRKKTSNCLQTLGVVWEAEEGITKACEKLLGKMDTHGVCMHANTHHVGNFPYVWLLSVTHTLVKL